MCGLRGWAIEIDRGKEGASIIREKAATYRRVATDRDFYGRYGRMPIPLWVVPNAARADIITRAWAEV